MKFFTKEWYERSDKTTADIAYAVEKYHQFCQKDFVCKEIQKNLHLHDAVLKRILLVNNNLVMEFDVMHSASDIIEVQFKQVEIKVNDNIRTGDYWLYEEIYHPSASYELHMLFCDRKNRAKEMIITFKNVEFRYDINKRKRLEKLKKLAHKTEDSSLVLAKGSLNEGAGLPKARQKTGDGSLS